MAANDKYLPLKLSKDLYLPAIWFWTKLNAGIVARIDQRSCCCWWPCIKEIILVGQGNMFSKLGI